MGSDQKLRYHKELEDMKRRQRKKKKALEQKEEQRNAKEAGDFCIFLHMFETFLHF